MVNENLGSQSPTFVFPDTLRHSVERSGALQYLTLTNNGYTQARWTHESKVTHRY